MPPVHINLIDIRTADVDVSAQFYRLLGLDFVKHSHGKGRSITLSKNSPGVLEIYPRQNEIVGSSGMRTGFGVHSVDEIVAALANAAATIVFPAKDSPWDKRAVLDNPDGCCVELTQPLSIEAAL